jgi:MraZ protein
VVTGSITYLEIWDAQAWQEYQTAHEENFSAASDETLRDII